MLKHLHVRLGCYTVFDSKIDAPPAADGFTSSIGVVMNLVSFEASLAYKKVVIECLNTGMESQADRVLGVSYRDVAVGAGRHFVLWWK